MDLFYKHKLHKKMLNIKDNYVEVYEFLHSRGIVERGHILSPTRDIWFDHYHYLQFHSYPYQEPYYKHCTSKQKLEGELLTVISFEEFKTYFEDTEEE